MRLRREFESGFTLTELVMVMVIAVILAAFAASTISTQGFHTEGYANQVLAMVRYAQKIAISQRRNVTVTVSGNTVSLTYPDAPLSGAAVPEPPGTGAFSKTAPSGVTVALDSGTSFNFSALGKPTAGRTISINSGEITITIEAETGHVH